MKRKNTFRSGLFGFILVCCFFWAGCEQKSVKDCTTFEELPDPAPSDPEWANVAPGLHVSFGSTDIRYAKSSVPDLTASPAHRITGWKGERVSAQLVLWTSEEISEVTCEFTVFNSSSATLSADIAQARFVRYVMTDIFEPGCGYRKPEDFPASLSADMLDNLKCFDIPAATVRPVWITIDIPESATSGIYKSKLTISAQGKKISEPELELEVINRILPPASQWSYHLDLWQHPSAVARIQDLPLWSDEHFEAMRPVMKLLADAGQKVITATLNKDPWNVQTFDRYEDMITWTKNTDESWSYDYTVFDRWIEFMQEIGINKMINCYSVVPWNNELHYIDIQTGDTVTVKADPGTPIFEEMWTPFLHDFTVHLKEKGWLKITNIAMDERSPEAMEATLELLAKAAPELGISLADNHKSYKKYPFINDMCVGADAKADSSDIASRRANGLITTYYVCCSHPFPNVFTFSDPAEATYAAWYALAADYDGFLRWAYNSWVENPLTDSRFRTWPAGDTYIVYPEARSSIRFERLREGIQDVEKIRILRAELLSQGTSQALEKLDRLNKEVSTFNTVTPTEPCAQMLNRAKKILNEPTE
jgi:hypothetical protein